nr:sideroflexin-1 isoform X3 [Salvelinus alpinus]
MAVPAMAIPPVIMNALEKKAFMKRFPVLNAPVQVGLVGLCLVFETPLCCALFPQKRQGSNFAGLRRNPHYHLSQIKETRGESLFEVMKRRRA